jgi:hypothetical protein
MRYLPPRRWHEVTPGTVIMYIDGPRAVAVEPYGLREVIVHAEGLTPVVMPALALVSPVELDDTDAIGNLLRAGLTLTPIKES